MATRAPSAANGFAVANPIPLLPPVIMATLSFNFCPIVFTSKATVSRGQSSRKNFAFFDADHFATGRYRSSVLPIFIDR